MAEPILNAPRVVAGIGMVRGAVFRGSSRVLRSPYQLLQM
jgi:hypothetical protein